MKRIISLLVAIIVAISMVACGKQNPVEYVNQEDFLEDMAKGISARLSMVDDGKTRTAEEEAAYYAKLVNCELDKIGVYESYKFNDELFNELVHGYISACKMQLVAAENYRNTDLYNSLWSGGRTLRNGIICEMYSRYNLPITAEEAENYSASGNNASYTASVDGILDPITGLTYYSDNMKDYNAITIKSFGSQVLYNDQGIKIILKSLKHASGEYAVNMTIENSMSSGSVSCWLGNADVDDYQISVYSPLGWNGADAGKKLDTYSQIRDSDLEDKGQTKFDTLSCDLYVVVAHGDSTADYIAKIPIKISRTAFN